MVEPPSNSIASPPSAAPPSRPSYVEEGLYYLLAWSERFFDLVPDAIGILDDSFRVRAANAAFLEFFELGSLSEARASSVEEHALFTSPLSPGENGANLGHLLRDQLQTGQPLALDRIQLAEQTGIADALSIRSLPWDLDNARSRRILLWIRRERREETPEPTARPAVSEERSDRYFTLKAFLEKLLESLPLGVCLLDPSLRVVTENSWMRGHAFGAGRVESGMDRHFFSLHPGLRDDHLQSALERCRALSASESVLLLPSAERSRALLVDLHACLPEGDTQGILVLVREEAASLSESVLLEEPAEPAVIESEAEETLEPTAPLSALSVAVKSVILVGASHADVPVLRLLYRTPGIHIRMIFDPDPEAFGLSLGRSLGIPVLAGNLQVQLESLPDAVVVARGGLEKHLERLGLDAVPRITRDEAELFLVDPDGFLASEGSIFEAVAPEEEEDGPVERIAVSWKTESIPSEVVPITEPPPAPSHVGTEVQSVLRAIDLLLDFSKLAEWVLDAALRLSGGMSGSLMLMQEEKPVLSIVASRGLKDIAVKHRRQRIGEGIAGRVAEDGEPLLLIGTVDDPRLKPMGARPEIRSSVSVPVLADSGIIGVLNVNSDANAKNFDSHELEEVAAFGRQLGNALSRSMHLRKLRSRAFEQSMCAEIAAIAETHSDLAMKLRQVTDRISHVLNADSCTIYLLNREKDALNLEAGSGVSASANEAVSVPIGSGVVGWVAKSRRPLVLRNPDEEIGDPQPTNLAFPIRHQTDLLGVLTIEASHPLAAEEERMTLIEAISSSIGTLIAGAVSAQLSERRVTMLSALSELGLAFSAASHRKGLARLVAFTASTVLESDVGLVRLRRADSNARIPDLGDLELLASHGASFPEESEPLRLLESLLVTRAMQSGQACRDLDLPLSETESLLKQSNVFTAMAVPLINSSQVILGSIMVCRVADPSGKGIQFGASEMDVAGRLSDYAAAAALKFPGHSDDDGKEEGKKE